ncbi:Hypothetical predicted protein [Mytilus galloprovincialis]|uniref:DUF4371 domain-containing protein n=2 Tax=Mytilus galloprovincialis TaxID=29158 RepID=A0A8B6C9Y1_MYTGA|nr:Hypothetical predicted protein [Mytilus galloprovincialis]
MFGFLKYTEGAIPGKATKKKKTEDEKKEKSKLYETNRPARKLNKKWQENRPWLKFENDTMTCSVCLDYYINTNKPGSSGLQRVRGQNTFITGCTNRKISAVLDHEISNAHEKAILSMHSKTVTNEEKITSNAGKALLSLKHAEREKLRILFVNTHAIIKNNRPLRDFPWLCKLDILKGLDLGDTYQNQKAALDFMTAIGQASSDKTVKLINSTNFFAFMMDGSTDISGDEQEVLYVRTSVDGKVVEQYLGIGSPKSTSSLDLKEFAVNMFDSCGLDKGKLVAMGSDGASNMVGRRSGLATLLRQEVNDEIINVHCFAHRLELAFRDVLKKEKKYDKLMTLLIGLYYFYMKSYKSKKGLLDTMKALNVDGILPAKVTGTRWLPHLTRAIICLIRNFPAYEAHLCSLSHTNPKAEGLVKIMLSKDVVCFVLFLKEALKPLQKLSLQLQKPESTLADSIHWVEATIELTHECKMIMRDSDEVKAVLDSGTYKSIKLRGNTPTMSYVNPLIDGFIEAMKTRFELNESEATVMNATKILHLKNWPKIESESDLKG